MSVYGKDMFSSMEYTLFDIKTYDLDGKLLEETWDDGYNCKYFYDNNNNPTYSYQNTGITTKYKIISSSEIEETWSNGIKKLYYYNQNHKLTREYYKYPDENNFNYYTEYIYDEYNRELSYSSYRGAKKISTSWNYYDENNILTRRTNSDGEEYVFVYDNTEQYIIRYNFKYTPKQKTLSIEEIHGILSKTNSTYWPEIDNSTLSPTGNNLSLSLKYVGSIKDYTLYVTTLATSPSLKATRRLVIFKNNKYTGNYCGINSENMYINDYKLIFTDAENKSEIDFSKELPSNIFIDGEILILQ